MIRIGDIVRVINNIGSPFLDEYIGEVSEVSFIKRKKSGFCIYLKHIPHIEFSTSELNLIDNELASLLNGTGITINNINKQTNK